MSGVKTAGFWSKNVLWNKPTLKSSVDDINKKFKSLNVKMKKNMLNSTKIAMDKLPLTILQHIYEYEPTYKTKLGKVLKQLSAHCFIYRCSECFKPYNLLLCNMWTLSQIL